MEEFFAGIFQTYGITGALVMCIGWLIYDKYKNGKSIIDNGQKIDKLIEHFDHVNDNIKMSIEDMRSDISEIKAENAAYKTKFENVDDQIANIDEKFDTKMSLLDEKFIDHLKFLKEDLSKQPARIISELQVKKSQIQKEHNSHMRNMVNLAPLLHNTMKAYIKKINCNHLFIGSFHNGTDSLGGIPYYKFDVIAEKFGETHIPQDSEFAPVYKDTDMLRHNMLPLLLVKEGSCHYVIDENGDSELKEIDEIVYRRMMEKGTKQLAGHLMVDKLGNPTGFLACVSYTYDMIDMQELVNCTHELEKIYIK